MPRCWLHLPLSSSLVSWEHQANFWDCLQKWALSQSSLSHCGEKPSHISKEQCLGSHLRRIALAPASSECIYQDFPLPSNIHPNKGPFASCPCQLVIYYKMHAYTRKRNYFVPFLISFVLPWLISLLHFNSSFTSDYLAQNSQQASSQHVANAILKIPNTHTPATQWN